LLFKNILNITIIGNEDNPLCRQTKRRGGGNLAPVVGREWIESYSECGCVI